MVILWQLGKGSIQKLTITLPEPKRSYSSIYICVRQLMQKDFVGRISNGKEYIYYPKTSYRSYMISYFNNLIINSFNGINADILSSQTSTKELSFRETPELQYLTEHSFENEMLQELTWYNDENE